ncbi:MAG: hypothetical protein IJ544_09080 [Prevotella sp.]|nr:hypothetical protein [Prevotella sp.]
MNAKERTSTKALKTPEIADFYNEILQHCEQDTFFAIPYDKRQKEYKQAKRDLGFDIKDTLNTLEQENETETNVFYFNSDTNIRQLLSHVRNAFAHNRIFKCNDEIVLEDVNKVSSKKQKKGEKPHLTMYARFSSFSKLMEIIKALKNCKK